MKIELKFLLAAVIAIALCYPVSNALEHRSQLLNIEKTRNSKLLIDIQSKQKQLEQDQRDKADKQKQIEDLKKQLQDQQPPDFEPASAVIAKRPTASCASYRDLVSQYNWDVNVALAVMQAESSCNTNDISSTCDHGLMQINCVHADLVAGNLNLLHDPATNIRVAYAIYSGDGWSPWVAYTSGAYLKYL